MSLLPRCVVVRTRVCLNDLRMHACMHVVLGVYVYPPPPPPPSAGTDGAFGWGLIITIWLIIHENNYDACAFNVLTTVERIIWRNCPYIGGHLALFFSN